MRCRNSRILPNYAIPTSGSYGGTLVQPMPVTFTIKNNNRVDQWSYDCAGDVTNDTNNMYSYDAEGRQTGVLNMTTGLNGYVYDAEGRRVEKLVVQGWNGPNPQTVIEDEYLLGLNGEQVTVLAQNGNWWTNVYAGGKQLATYDNAGTHFPLTDWLGTKRMELSVTAPSTVSVAERCTSLPFGDNLSCNGTDVNQLHFTGKQRDQESGNDYFGARYYNSNIGGRFLTPDWSDSPDTVPYADLKNPQSLNLYSYVLNNPLKSTDSDGHTHRECGPDTSFTDAKGTYHVVAGACHDVPDWWNFETNFLNWRQNFVSSWNQRIAAHQPPQQNQNPDQFLQDVNNIMMGAVLVGGGPWKSSWGWNNSPDYIKARNELKTAGDHPELNGKVPTREEATQMIKESGGTVKRSEPGHDPGGVSTHTEPHINYTTASGMKATVTVTE